MGNGLWNALRSLGQSANISPKILFCHQRAGHLISEGHEHLFSEEALESWDQACLEFDALTAEGIDPLAFLDYRSRAEHDAFRFINERLREAIIHPGSFIDKNHDVLDSIDKFAILYYSARSFNSLKLLYSLMQQSSTRDAIAIARPIYECWLRIRFVHVDPTAAESFFAQAEIGNSNVAFKTDGKGKKKRGWIVDKATGKGYKARYTLRDIASTTNDPDDVFLYNELYSFLSSASHADLSDLALFYSDNDGLFHQGHKEDPLAALPAAVTLSIFLFHDLANIIFFTKLSRRDSMFYAKNTGKMVLAAQDRFLNIDFLSDFLGCRRRLLLISRPRLSV